MFPAMLLPCALCLAVLPTSLASEGCEASGRSLLQASVKQRQLKTEEGMAASTLTLEMTRQIRAIIDDTMAKKRNLTSGEHGAFQLMNTSLENTIATIKAGHVDDQTLMNVAQGTLGNCNTNFQNASGDAATLESGAETKKQTHISCRAMESSMSTSNATEWQDLMSFLSNLALPNITMPSSPLDLEPYFADMIGWFTHNNLSYTEHETSFESAQEALQAKEPECDLAQSSFESSYCQWHTSAESAGDEFERCWDEGMASFNTTVVAVLDSAEQRKVEFTAVRTLQCYMKVLDAGIESAEDRLAGCQALVVDTSSLDVLNTALPAKGDVSQLGDLTLMPGDSMWAAQEYAGLASNSPAAEITACSHHE